MDSKALELYHEEQRQKLIDLGESVGELKRALDGVLKVQEANPTTEMKVSGAVLVNTEKAVEITNIHEFVAGVDKLAETLAKAIGETFIAPPTEITVTNIKDAQTSSIEVKNFQELKQEFENLTRAIESNTPIVNVEKQEIVWPTNPKQPISVRLSDGKGWINQLVQGVASGVAENDPLVGYQPCDIEEAGTPKYYGFAKNNGSWYIMRESSGAYRYTKGAPQFNGGGLYADAWADKANLSYGYIFEVFK